MNRNTQFSIARHSLPIAILAIALIAISTNTVNAQTGTFAGQDVHYWTLPLTGTTDNPHHVDAASTKFNIVADVPSGPVPTAVFGLIGEIESGATGIEFVYPVDPDDDLDPLYMVPPTSPFVGPNDFIEAEDFDGNTQIFRVNGVNNESGDLDINDGDALIDLNLSIPGGYLNPGLNPTFIESSFALNLGILPDGGDTADFTGYRNTNGDDLTVVGAIPSASLTVHQSLIGDINGDGNINAGDVNAFITAFGAGGTNEQVSALGGIVQTAFVSDINQDGNVNAGDVNAFIAAFGAGTSPSLTPFSGAPVPVNAVVPEPSSIALLFFALGALGLFGYRKNTK